MKKVLHLTKFFHPQVGGMESVMKNIADYFNHNNSYKIDVFCAHVSPNVKIDKYKSSIIIRYGRLFTFGRTSFSLSAFSIFKKINKKYDALHLHHPDPLLVLLLFFIRVKIPLVIHWHGDVQKKAIVLFRPLQNWMLKRSEIIVVTSQEYLDGSPHLKNFKQKCRVVPIGIPDESFQSEEQVVRRSDKKIVFALGRLIYYKGFPYLIKAAKYLHNDIEVIIAGEGGDKEKLLQLIKDDNVQNRVTLVGRVTDEQKIALFKTCSLFCLPSINKAEAFGVVLLEAMSFSKPLVTFHIEGSGVNALNRNNITGLMANSFDEKKLAEAINKICADNALEKRLASQARLSYEQNFTIEAMGSKLEKVYDKFFLN